MLFVRRVAWLALIAFVAVVAGEATARIDDAVRMGTPLLASPAHSDLMMHDSLGIRGRPNAQFQKWKLNGEGFRSPEVAKTPKPGCVRVAVMGASETFGYYESEGKEWPAQFADSLARNGCYEVVNTAIAGMSLPAQIQLWDKWVSQFRPDIVVLYIPPAFYLSDDPPSFPAPTRSGPDSPSTRFVPRLLDRLKDRIEFPEFIQRRRVAKSIDRAVAGKPDTWFYRDLPADRLALYRTHMDSLISNIRATGAVPVLVTHAMRFGDPPKPDDADLLMSWHKFTPRATADVLLAFERAAAATTRDIAREQGLQLVDVAAAMTGHTEWFADFTHFDDNGAGIIAGAIAKAVERVPVPRVPREPVAVTGYGR